MRKLNNVETVTQLNKITPIPHQTNITAKVWPLTINNFIAIIIWKIEDIMPNRTKVNK